MCRFPNQKIGEHPFSRSYGVILPSSFDMVLSSALVYSTCSPVSVWGTKRRGKLSSRSLLVFPSSNKENETWRKRNEHFAEEQNFVFFFLQSPNPPRSPLLTGSRLISLPLATQMFQFAKFEKSKEHRLATELGYGFPIGDPWITDGISPWPFASKSVLPSQCPGIHPMHSF
ncbi:hypothetical protein R6Q59_007103 [Mikania micrantha]